MPQILLTLPKSYILGVEYEPPMPLSGLIVVSPELSGTISELFSKLVTLLVLCLNILSVKLTRKMVFEGTIFTSNEPSMYKPNARPPN